MIRTIYTGVRAVMYAVLSTGRLKKAEKMREQGLVEDHKKAVFYSTEKFGKTIMEAAGATVEVKGIENLPKDQNVLFVGNHQSNFDIPLLLGYLPRMIGFISKMEVKKIPIARTWMREMYCVFMDRSDRRQSLKAIKEGIENLKNGYNMVIFPEGTRSKGGPVDEFKAGSLTLATKSGVPIVPIAINGTYKLLEANNNRVKPAHVTLTILKPIYLNPEEKVDGKVLAEQVRQQIIDAL
ncbi:MAG: lysophospholipid acyltransferase family protein [Bacillaceae bacterium]